MKWEDLVDPFTGSKSRRFDWVDDDGNKRAELVTEDSALYLLPPEDVADLFRNQPPLF